MWRLLFILALTSAVACGEDDSQPILDDEGSPCRDIEEADIGFNTVEPVPAFGHLMVYAYIAEQNDDRIEAPFRLNRLQEQEGEDGEVTLEIIDCFGGMTREEDPQLRVRLEPGLYEVDCLNTEDGRLVTRSAEGALEPYNDIEIQNGSRASAGCVYFD